MKRILTLLPAILLFLLLATGSAGLLQGQNSVRAGEPPGLIPYTLFHDFETGEMFGWEPYPYQQDIGYDALFFTRKSPSYNGSKFALARPVRANDTVELYQGFTRRVNMWTSTDTRLQAAVFFQSDRNPEKLEISLGTFDGRLYSLTVTNPDANRWVELDIPLRTFRDEAGRSLAAGEHIQAVTLEASYPVVYYLLTYTMLMDDFKLNGERQHRFVAEEPGSAHFENLDRSILTRHYFYGDELSLKVQPEDAVALDGVYGRLVDSTGRPVREDISFERRGDAWVNDNVHQFKETDRRGLWEIQLTGERAGSGDIRWNFGFLVPGRQPDDHPRLFFTREELDKRLTGEDSPVAKKILENAISASRELLDRSDAGRFNEAAGEVYVRRTKEAWTGGPYSGWRERLGEWLDPMYGLGDMIQEGSQLYAFTGDREAGIKAKEALLKLSSFRNWNPHWKIENRMHIYLYVGRVVSTVSYGYDMLYDLLSEEERAFVREALMDKGIRPFHRDMVVMNRMPSQNTNHIARIVSGIGQAATVLYGEDPENPSMEPYLSGILTKFRAYLDNNHGPGGGAGEPFIYLAGATAYSAELMAVLEKNFGVDWSETTDAGSFYHYPLYATDAAGKYADYGDGGRIYDRFTNLAGQWFVHRTGDPLLYSYVKPYWEQGNGGYLGYLWYRDDIEPASRKSLPTSFFVEKNGIQLMRSGWEDESTVISFKAGPHANHFHYDQGTFRIMTNGSELITDPLIPDGGYYTNLEFPVYNIHAISKNVMLIDHDPESQKPAHYDNGIAALNDWPRVTHTFTGEIADAVESDLTTVYKDKLENYTRTLLYTKHGPLFLFDHVRSFSDEGHTFSWLFHAPQNEGNQRSLDYVENRLTVERPGARLTMDVLSPDISSAPIRDNNDPGYPESFVSLNTVPGRTEADFLAVMVPEAPADGEYGSRPLVEKIRVQGWLGARVKHRGMVDYGFFRTNSGVFPVEGFTTDASRFTASFDSGDRLVRFYVQGSFFEGYGESMNSSGPVTMALSHESGETRLEVDSGTPGRITFAVLERPEQILLDTSPVRYNYDSDSGRTSLQIPDGRHDILVKY